MSNTVLFANNALSSLAGAITNVQTTANLAAGTGVLFPNPGASQYFNLTFIDAATGLINEIVKVTGMSGDSITAMTRGQEGTSARPWLAGDLAQGLITAGALQAFFQTANLQPARIITASGAFAMTTADANGGIGLNRLSSPAASSTTLPSGATPGDLYSIEDLAGNFNAFPVTVNYPAGMTGPEGSLLQVLNVNKQCGKFRFYGSNIWSYQP